MVFPWFSHGLPMVFPLKNGGSFHGKQLEPEGSTRGPGRGKKKTSTEVLNERQKGAIVCPAVATTRLERASHKSGPNLKAPAMETSLEVITTILVIWPKLPFFQTSM